MKIYYRSLRQIMFTIIYQSKFNFQIINKSSLVLKFLPKKNNLTKLFCHHRLLTSGQSYMNFDR